MIGMKFSYLGKTREALLIPKKDNTKLNREVMGSFAVATVAFWGPRLALIDQYLVEI